MRIICAELKQESNSFSPLATDLEDFESYHLYRGPQVTDRLSDTRTEIGGFFALARHEGAEIAPAMAAMAMSGGQVRRDAFGVLRDELRRRIRGLLPADGLLLALHGAMLVEGLDDPEHALLAAVRDVVGSTPLVITLDLHANPSAAMLHCADAVVGFDTCPHTDLFETGVRAGELLFRMIRDRLRPQKAFVRVPMILPVEAVDTSEAGPAMDLVQGAIARRHRDGVLSTSVFFAQPWLDVGRLGCSVLAIFAGDPARALGTSADLAQHLWNRRGTFHADYCSLDRAVELALGADGAPWVWSDVADSIGAGATGDATAIIRRLLDVREQLPGDALTTIVDAEAAREAACWLPGQAISVTVGGKMGNRFSQPLRLDGVLRTIFHGDFRLLGPSYTNLTMHMGLTSVVEVGRLKVVITSKRTWTHSPDFYRAVGLDPLRAKVVVTKSNTTFKASYQPLAYRILRVNATGASSPDLVSLPYRKRPNPLYPFEDSAWSPHPRLV